MLSSTPTIPVVPTNVSDFTNDAGYQTAQDVQDAISGKANTSALTAHTSDTTIHVTSADKTAWDGKQDAITNDNKLDYSLLSGTPEVPTVEWGAISGILSNQTDLQNALNAKANASDIPLSTSQLTNDSGFITDSALSGKQDVIDANNKLDYSLVSGAPTVPTSTSQLTNDSDFIDQTALETALSGKQDAITNDNKLDYSLLSGTPTIPTKTSDLTNDSDFATSGYVDNAVSSKIDNPSGGTVGQVLTKTADGEEWADSQGGGSGDAKNVTIENKIKSGNTFVVDFLNGKQIQKYNIAYAVSESLQISIADNFSSLPSGVAPTVELQIPVVSDVSSVILPNNVQIIEMPEILSGAGGIENTYKYHDIVFRAEKDCNDIWKTYANYAYAFNEVFTGPPSPMPTSGLVFYAPLTNASTPYAETGQALTYNGAVNATTEDGISCLYFGSRSSKLISTDSSNLPSGKASFTMSIWVKAPEVIADCVCAFGGNGESLSMAGIGFWNYAYTLGYNTGDLIADNPTPDTSWHHFVGVSDVENDVNKIYVDGTLVATGTPLPEYSIVPGEIQVKPPNNSLLRYAAAMRIYDRVLTDDEITALATEFNPTSN